MATYLHTMLRITDPEQSRSFYEALGFTFSRDMDIVRNGELEATNYFYSLGDDEITVLEGWAGDLYGIPVKSTIEAILLRGSRNGHEVARTQHRELTERLGDVFSRSLALANLAVTTAVLWLMERA